MSKEQHLTKEEAKFELEVRGMFELQDASPELKERVRFSLNQAADTAVESDGENKVIPMPGMWQKHWWKAAAVVAGAATGMALWNSGDAPNGAGSVVESTPSPALDGSGLIPVSGKSVIVNKEFEGIKSPIEGGGPVYKTRLIKMNTMEFKDPDTGKTLRRVVPEEEVIFQRVRFQ